MKKEDVIFERKEFLNLPGKNGQANIVASITTSENYRDNDDEDGKPLYKNLDIVLDFADCSRVVTMDLDEVHDEYGRENVMFKVDTLIDVLIDFRTTLKKELKYQHRLEKKRNRIEAEKKAKEKAKEKEEED